MYFYCFSLPSSIHLRKFYEPFPRARRFRVFRVIRSFKKNSPKKDPFNPSNPMYYILDVPYNSTLSNSTCAHGAQFNTQHSTLNIHPVAQAGARTCCHAFRGGRCAACYPRGPQAVKNKKYLIM